MKRTAFFIFLFLVMTAMAGARPAEMPNVIIIGVDAMRADHMGAYGYPRNTTPHLDRLAEEGVKFTDATTHIPLTNPAAAVMFSSLLPYKTGSIRNGLPVKEGIETLPGILREHGYTTVAVAGCAPLYHSRSGLNRDFDYWLDKGLVFRFELDAETMTDRAVELFESGLKEPFLFWTHFPEPHQPHKEYEEYSFKQEPPAGGKERSKVEDSYDSELAYCDHHAHLILKALEEKGYLDNALIIITSDHGEHLGGGGKAVGHGRLLYQSVVNVPLIMKGPGIEAGKTIHEPVQFLDFAPTILSCLGISPGNNMTGRDLMPLIQNGVSPEPVPFYLETYSYMVPDIWLWKVAARKSSPMLVGMRKGDYKVIYNFTGSSWELYNLAEDPHEKNNIFEKDSDKAENLARELDVWYEDRGRAEASLRMP
ncbi:MAG: sulfatase [bacterium]